MTVPILQIEKWNIRIDTAIEQGQNSGDNNDIREYGRLSKEITDRNKHRFRYRKKDSKSRCVNQKKISSYIRSLR